LLRFGDNSKTHQPRKSQSGLSGSHMEMMRHPGGIRREQQQIHDYGVNKYEK
jgi:hypothetical protein